MKIEIRKKELKNGGCSLYLDIYHNGERRYEFLKLYLVAERTRQDKMQNKETLRVAEAVRAERLVEYERSGYNLRATTGSETVVEWLEAEVARKEKLRGVSMRYCLMQTIVPHVRAFFGNTRLRDLTRERVLRFRDFIAALPFKQNTKSIYFSNFKTAINQAILHNKVNADCLATVSSLPMAESTREFLTMDEVRVLAKTECADKGLKRAFLFSCLTGLRRIDVSRLVWGNVSEVGGFTRLTFVQKKTGGQEYLEISEQAAELMGERGGDTERVFGDLSINSRMGRKLTAWGRSVGIDKHISFHSARHTFAVMMLELGVNIAVIQKLLGHRDLSTTMIYAKVLDKSKRAAVTLIPQLL